MDEVLRLFQQQLPEGAYEYERPGVIHYFPGQQEIYGSGGVDGIHMLINHMLNRYNVDRAEIICFGNNLYGKEVMNLWEHYPHIKIRLMVCSPSVEIINNRDKDTLTRKIAQAAEHTENTEFYAAESPPTFRTCVLYENEEPVLCCIQHYVISMLEERLPCFKGRQTPCIMIYHNGKEFPMKQYVESCEKEFERLLEEDAYVPVINSMTREVERPNVDFYDD